MTLFKIIDKCVHTEHIEKVNRMSRKLKNEFKINRIKKYLKKHVDII